MKWFKVLLDEEEIDQIYLPDDTPLDEIKKSLVDHDGYDSSIEIEED